MTASSPIRILLVDDHTLFRESLRRLLEEDPDYLVVAEVATVGDALELCRNGTSFDLALVDYDLGPAAGAKNGMSVLRCLRERKEFIPALMIAAQIDPKDLLTVVKDLRTGIFLKADPPEELSLALNKTMRREVWISSGIALNLVEDAVAEQSRSADATITFDLREREILSLVVEGLSNKEISSRLDLSESVVKVTVQRLLDKAGVRTRAQLVRFAFESGSVVL
jgi:DNA-binding NarL/FixJ family response regulator